MQDLAGMTGRMAGSDTDVDKPLASQCSAPTTTTLTATTTGDQLDMESSQIPEATTQLDNSLE